MALPERSFFSSCQPLSETGLTQRALEKIIQDKKKIHFNPPPPPLLSYRTYSVKM